MDHLNHKKRQSGVLSSVDTINLVLTAADDISIDVQVSVDGMKLPVDSKGTASAFASIDTGECVVDLADGSSIVLVGVNEPSSDIVPPKAVVGITCG
jgi:hypothetical protein